MYKAEQYDSVYSEALRELLAATEAIAQVSRSRCGVGSVESISAEQTVDIYDLLARYVEVNSRYKSINAEFERLGQQYGGLCLNFA